MDRRAFLGIVAAGALARPLTAAAQPKKTYRVGVLGTTRFNNTTLGAVLAEGLGKRGYVAGRNLVIEERLADGKLERLPALAAELVRLPVDIIAAGPTEAIRAAREATSAIPIVMAYSGDDPVTSGFVASLARPGGNVTGVTALARDLAPKMVEVLRDAVPGITHVGVMANPTRPEHAAYLSIMHTTPPHGVQLYAVEAGGPAQYEAAIARMTREHVRGFVVLGDITFTRDSARIAELAARHRLAAVSLYRVFAAAGGLLAYGPDQARLLDLSASYIDQILKGAKPADLPVQQPTEFRLVVNLKTAKTLGLTMPPSVLLRADEVIE